MGKKESDETLKKIFEHQARLDLTCRFPMDGKCRRYLGQQKCIALRNYRLFSGQRIRP